VVLEDDTPKFLRGRSLYDLVVMEERSPYEAIIDRLLLLYVASRTREKGHNILGQIKLQKMLYKTQERMYLAKFKGLNYNFIRWQFGPFSQEIYSDVRDLKATGFLISQDTASVSEKGHKLLTALAPVFDDEMKDLIDRVINEFGPYTGRQIRKVMYSYPKVGEKKTIEEAEMGELLLSKLHQVDAKRHVHMDEQTFETLRFLFDPTSSKELKKSLDALKTEKCKVFTPVRQ
jgi:uncharacterized phage-associated protein